MIVQSLCISKPLLTRMAFKSCSTAFLVSKMQTNSNHHSRFSEGSCLIRVWWALSPLISVKRLSHIDPRSALRRQEKGFFWLGSKSYSGLSATNLTSAHFKQLTIELKTMHYCLRHGMLTVWSSMWLRLNVSEP